MPELEQSFVFKNKLKNQTSIVLIAQLSGQKHKIFPHLLWIEIALELTGYN